MIEKLRKKISLIIFFAISLPLFLIVILYLTSYYNNTIRINTQFIDRFFEKPKEDPKGKIEENEKNREEQEKNQEEKRNERMELISMDGIYTISVKDNEIISSSDNITDKIKELAIKVSKNKKEIGIIGNYIYKKRIHDFEKDTSIILMESKSEINKIKLVTIGTILIFGAGLILIFILSKKIAIIIVKPVEDTFQKQIDFISDASHELKTPLAVISANADVLEGEIGKNKWLSYIQKETDNMGKLIGELLLLTKIENIDKLRKPEKFNMSSHIELTTSSFESMAFEKKVKIETKIEKDIITEKYNREDITHILSTLLDNAIKHTEEKKKVIVEFYKNKDKLIIKVKNKGEEIPISERDKIFDRFYRIDKSRNRNEKRYGLGLSIAKATVLKNNGTIFVDYQEGYTIFTVELPG